MRGDAIYVIRVAEELLVKRVQLLLDGALIIRSDNPAYREQSIAANKAGEIKIIGEVVWSGQRM